MQSVILRDGPQYRKSIAARQRKLYSKAKLNTSSKHILHARKNVIHLSNTIQFCLTIQNLSEHVDRTG